ncbi:hypothetical protein Tco_0769550 [Tanacetum coccineum]|uniref:Uncharacterized protein n=1 Tax=Tanacetum coccineum TaxID=301880 RepID=A0ABQ4Z9P7_9ASTR
MNMALALMAKDSTQTEADGGANGGISVRLYCWAEWLGYQKWYMQLQNVGHQVGQDAVQIEWAKRWLGHLVGTVYSSDQGERDAAYLQTQLTLNHLQRSDESLAKRKALELEIVRLLRAVVSDQKGNTNKVYECDTKFAKQSILGKPPSSSRPNTVKPVYSTNIYAFPTVGETKCFVLKSSTSKLSSSSESPIVVNTERSDCSRIFRSILLKLLGSGLQVVTNGRFFDIQGQIRVLSKSESQSDCSKGDNACTSNPQEPINKRFPSSTFSMSGCQKWFDTLLIPLLSEYNLEDKEDHGDNECDT